MSKRTEISAGTLRVDRIYGRWSMCVLGGEKALLEALNKPLMHKELVSYTQRLFSKMWKKKQKSHNHIFQLRVTKCLNTAFLTEKSFYFSQRVRPQIDEIFTINYKGGNLSYSYRCRRRLWKRKEVFKKPDLLLLLHAHLYTLHLAS